MGSVSSHADEVYFLDLMEKRERLESRRQAAQALGVHPQHLYNIEKRRSGVSLPLALRIVRRYGPLHLVSAADGAIFRIQQVNEPPKAGSSKRAADPLPDASGSWDD